MKHVKDIMDQMYDDDFKINISARGGGKRRSKSECKANKSKSPYSSKHVRKVVFVAVKDI
jgi:hypothetical protein